jgi:glyoxylase-like metal-dependent hydrolase (beta-lactamase superfamily II)
MKLFSINTGYFKLDGGAMFGVVPKVMWQKLYPSDENNLCNWAMRCLLIDTGHRRILVDTGIGNKQSEKFMSHYYLNGHETLESSLQMEGYTTKDITDVILTHLHFDHCGGAIVRHNHQLVPAFENATYWSNERHWHWGTNPNEREKASFLPENILPIQESGRLRFLPVAETGLIPFDNEPNIHIRFAFGHTDAMMLPQITIGGKTLVFMADLLPAVAHLPLPYVMAYDMFPLKTLSEKKMFLEEAVSQDYILFLEHDAHIECCTLQHTDKGIRALKTGSLQALLAP